MKTPGSVAPRYHADPVARRGAPAVKGLVGSTADNADGLAARRGRSSAIAGRAVLLPAPGGPVEAIRLARRRAGRRGDQLGRARRVVLDDQIASAAARRSQCGGARSGRRRPGRRGGGAVISAGDERLPCSRASAWRHGAHDLVHGWPPPAPEERIVGTAYTHVVPATSSAHRCPH